PPGPAAGTVRTALRARGGAASSHARLPDQPPELSVPPFVHEEAQRPHTLASRTSRRNCPYRPSCTRRRSVLTRSPPGPAAGTVRTALRARGGAASSHARLPDQPPELSVPPFVHEEAQRPHTLASRT